MRNRAGSTGSRKRSSSVLGALTAQAVDRVGADEPPVLDDAHPVRHPLDLVELVRREEHGAPAAGGLAQELLELVLHEGIEPRGGLVEDEQLGLVHEGEDDPHLLTVPLGELLHPPVEGQREALGQLAAHPVPARPRARANQAMWSRAVMRPNRARSPGR